jgi:alpha-L-rhamnosidase
MYSKAGAFITLLRATPVSRIENGLGDWMGIEDSALGLTGWAFAYQCYSAFASLAEAVGDAPAAAAARADAASTMATINAKFLDEQGTPGLYRCSKAANCTSAQFNNTQCGQALPLYFGLVPPQLAPSTLALLVDNLAAHGNHLQVGSFALKYLLMALGDAGRPDLSYAIMSHTDYPSFGYMLGMNATTAWESWFYSADTFSHNHPMFTSGSTYLFQSLAGMRAAPGAFGVDRLELVPRPPPPTSGLTFVQASWETVRGRVASAWSYLNSTALNLTFSIPPNVQALLTLPLSQRTIPLGSGEYSFVDSAA